MVKITGRKTSINVQRVMWAVAELGVEHTRVDAGGPFGGLDTQEYAAMNPNRLVPVIEDQGLVLWESNAICRYLCLLAGSDARGLYPAEPGARASVERWLDWQLTTLSPAARPSSTWA